MEANESSCNFEESLNILYDKDVFLSFLKAYCNSLGPATLESDLDWSSFADVSSSWWPFSSAETTWMYWRMISKDIERERSFRQLVSDAKQEAFVGDESSQEAPPSTYKFFLESNIQAAYRKYPHRSSEKIHRRLRKRWLRLDKAERRVYVDECLRRQVDLFKNGKVSRFNVLELLEVVPPPNTEYLYFHSVKSDEVDSSLRSSEKRRIISALWKRLPMEDRRKYHVEYCEKRGRFQNYLSTLPLDLQDSIKTVAKFNGLKDDEHRQERPKAIKGPCRSVYLCFKMNRIKEISPELSFAEKSSIVSLEWKSMSEEEKSIWMERFENFDMSSHEDGVPETTSPDNRTLPSPIMPSTGNQDKLDHLANGYDLYHNRRTKDFPFSMRKTCLTALITKEWKAMSLLEQKETIRLLLEDGVWKPNVIHKVASKDDKGRVFSDIDIGKTPEVCRSPEASLDQADIAAEDQFDISRLSEWDRFLNPSLVGFCQRLHFDWRTLVQQQTNRLKVRKLKGSTKSSSDCNKKQPGHLSIKERNGSTKRGRPSRRDKKQPYIRQRNGSTKRGRPSPRDKKPSVHLNVQERNGSTKRGPASNCDMEHPNPPSMQGLRRSARLYRT